MMGLSRYYEPCVRMGCEELDGLLNVLDRTIDEMGEEGLDTRAYTGAYAAVSIIRYHEFIGTQADFMRLFAKVIKELEEE